MAYAAVARITAEAGAEAVSIHQGEPVTLNWTTSNATACEADQGIGPLELNGSLELWPEETTTYNFTATGPGGITTASVAVEVLIARPTVEIAGPAEFILPR